MEETFLNKSYINLWKTFNSIVGEKIIIYSLKNLNSWINPWTNFSKKFLIKFLNAKQKLSKFFFQVFKIVINGGFRKKNREKFLQKSLDLLFNFDD